MDSLVLLATHPWLLVTVCGIWGLFMGSFLNVVVHRLPRMMEAGWTLSAREHLRLPTRGAGPRYDLLWPPSTCPACGTRISPAYNIPVFGWLVLRGKAACCGARVSARYPLVEALTGALSALVAWRFGYGLFLLPALGFTWALLALTFIDFDTQLLPDSITLPLLWAGLLVNAMSAFGLGPAAGPILVHGLASGSPMTVVDAVAGLFTRLPDAVLGAAVGYVSLWAVNAGYRKLRGRDGMGGGDFKLLAALGAWFGWLALPWVVICSAGVGIVLGLGLRLSGGLKAGQPIPFGPFLALAGIIWLLKPAAWLPF